MCSLQHTLVGAVDGRLLDVQQQHAYEQPDHAIPKLDGGLAFRTCPSSYNGVKLLVVKTNTIAQALVITPRY